MAPNATNEALSNSPNKSTGKYTHENTGSFILYCLCTYVTVKLVRIPSPDGSEHLTSDSKGPGSNQFLVCHFLYHHIAHAINIFVKFMQTNLLLQKHLMGSTGLTFFICCWFIALVCLAFVIFSLKYIQWISSGFRQTPNETDNRNHAEL